MLLGKMKMKKKFSMNQVHMLLTKFIRVYKQIPSFVNMTSYSIIRQMSVSYTLASYEMYY